jgi:hypothetical protein
MVIEIPGGQLVPPSAARTSIGFWPTCVIPLVLRAPIDGSGPSRSSHSSSQPPRYVPEGSSGTTSVRVDRLTTRYDARNVVPGRAAVGLTASPSTRSASTTSRGVETRERDVAITRSEEVRHDHRDAQS